MNTVLRIAMIAALVALAACGRKEEATPAQPATPSKPAPAIKPAPAKTPANPPSHSKPPVPVAVTNNAVSHTLPTIAQIRAGGEKALPELEAAYASNPDFAKRVEAIYQISDKGTPEAVATLGRLFHVEKDPDLKIEILSSLFDFDGLDDRKITILGAGIAADQPKEVREEAIDSLGDVDSKYALPLLQSLLSDPDEEIREAAKDQIELLHAESAMQK